MSPTQMSALLEMPKTAREKKFCPTKPINRKSPTPPNFKRTAAKNIDPPTGASTWALGSHMWVINIGSFTKKARLKHKLDKNSCLLGPQMQPVAVKNEVSNQAS